VNDIQLTVFPTPHAKQETEDIRLLLFVKFSNVFVGAHVDVIVVLNGVVNKVSLLYSISAIAVADRSDENIKGSGNYIIAYHYIIFDPLFSTDR